jgi:hypothetical protein
MDFAPLVPGQDRKLCPVYDSVGFCQGRYFNSRAESASGGQDRVKGAALWRSS